MEISDIENYDDIIDIFYDNENFIEKNYQSKEDQILIHSELIIKLVTYLKKPIYNTINKTKLVKELIKDVLELGDNDLIIIKKDFVFIKLYDDKTRENIVAHEVETVENRYNGINQFELESFYNEQFKEVNIDIFFFNISNLFFQKYFIDTKITNEMYERDIFKIIQKLIIEDLASKFDCSIEFYKGFSGYIFRKHFRLLFNFLAQKLLKEVAYSNDTVINFLKYYTLNIIVLKSVKYRVPEFTAQNNVKWHIVSIISIAKVYVKVQEYINQKDTSIKKLEDKIQLLYIDNISPIKYNEKNLEKFKKLNTLIEKNSLKIDNVHDSLHLCKNNDEELQLEQELEKLQDERSILRDKKSDLKSQKIKQTIIDKYNDFLNQIDSLKKECNTKQRILDQNKESYDSITNALINALTSKKKVIIN